MGTGGHGSAHVDIRMWMYVRCPAGGCRCRSCLYSGRVKGQGLVGAEPGSTLGPPDPRHHSDT